MTHDDVAMKLSSHHYFGDIPVKGKVGKNNSFGILTL
jgi:hypothetical protein